MLSTLSTPLRAASAHLAAAWSLVSKAAVTSSLRCPPTRLGSALRAYVEQRADPKNLFFVQIGAHDGVSNDPIHDLIVAHGWRGVLVEPHPDSFAALEALHGERRGLRLVNAAVDTRRGQRTLYTVEPDRLDDAPEWLSQIASFSRETLMAHEPLAPGLEDALEEHETRCLTFDDLVEMARPRRIDLLVIDVEGYDAHILRSIDFTRSRPDVIVFENKHLSTSAYTEVLGLLRTAGYAVRFAGHDSIALQTSTTA